MPKVQVDPKPALPRGLLLKGLPHLPLPQPLLGALKAHISETTLPTELTPAATTMEYILPQTSAIPGICVRGGHLWHTERTAVPQVLPAAKPQSPAVESLVGFITFGKNAYLYNLSWAECSRCYAFRGDKTYDIQMVKNQLGFTGNDPRGVQSGARKFLMPAGECEFTLNAIIEELRKDPWPVPAGTRPLQCTGNALFLAVTSLEIAFPKHGARVMLFSGGAASFGPGMIVGEVLVASFARRTISSTRRPCTSRPLLRVRESGPVGLRQRLLCRRVLLRHRPDRDTGDAFAQREDRRVPSADRYLQIRCVHLLLAEDLLAGRHRALQMGFNAQSSCSPRATSR